MLAAVSCTAIACSKDPAAERQKRFDQGEAHAAAGRWPEAIVEYKAAVQADASFGKAHQRLAEAYVKASNYGGALEEFVRAADVLPGDVEAQLVAGQYLLLAERFEDAKTRALHVLDKNPQNAGALLLLGNAWAGLKNYDESLKALDRSATADPNRAMTYATRGNIEAVRGRKSEAEAAFLKAIDVEPKSVNARIALGNFYAAQGDTTKAEAAFNAAAELEPSNPLPAKALASMYVSNRNAAKAEPFLRRLADAKDPAAGFALADLLVDRGRVDEALTRLTAMAADPPTHVSGTLRLAALEFASGRREAGYQHIDQLLREQPQSAPAHSLRGRFLLVDKRLDEAAAAMQAAVTADPKYVPGHFWLAQTLLRQQRNAEARAALTTALQLEPTYVPAMVELSRQHLASGEFDQATEFARQAVRAAPADLDARIALPRVWVATGQADKAEPEIAALLKVAPKDPRVRTLDGQLNLARRNLKAAEAKFADVLASTPTAYDALDGMLTARLASGNIAGAIEGAAAAATRTPDDSRALVIAARTYAQARDLSKAETTLRRAIEVDPNAVDAYALLGQVYLALNRSDEALKEFEAAAKLQPSAIGPRTVVAVLQHTSGRRAEAKRAYEAVLSVDPTAVVAANNLAWMKMEDGENLDVALQLAQTAKAKAPRVAAVSDTLGWIYYKKALYPSAIVALSDAVRYDAKNAGYQYHLGMAYTKSGDLAKARVAFDAALKLNPALPEAAEVRALLSRGQ